MTIKELMKLLSVSEISNLNWVDSTYPGYTDGYEMMVLTEN